MYKIFTYYIFLKYIFSNFKKNSKTEIVVLIINNVIHLLQNKIT